MRRSHLSAVALALVALLGACDDDSNAPEPVARLRFVHAMPATGAVNVKWSGDALVSGVAYAASSAAYQNVDPGQHSLAVRLTSGSADLASKLLTLLDGRTYTALLVKSGSSADVALLADTSTAPASGRVKLRAVHAAASVTGNVDVYVTSPGADLSGATASATAVAPGTAAKYLELAAGTHQVRFTSAGSKTVVLDAGSVTLAAGQVRTVIALDADAGGTPLRAITLQDRNP